MFSQLVFLVFFIILVKVNFLLTSTLHAGLMSLVCSLIHLELVAFAECHLCVLTQEHKELFIVLLRWHLFDLRVK